MNINLKISFLLIVCLGLSMTVFAFADTDGQQRCTGQSLPLRTDDQVIEALACESGGKVLRLEPQQKAGRSSMFEARLLMPNGLIKLVRVNADSGKIQSEDKQAEKKEE